MADDFQDKTEAPTPRRLEEARAEGRVPRSTDLAAAIGVLASLLLLKSLGGSILEQLLVMTRNLGNSANPSLSDLPSATLLYVRLTAWALLPFLIILTVISASTLAAQSGVVLAWKKLTPELGRVNPLKGFQRLLSTESLVRLILNLLKIGMLLACAAYSLPGRLSGIISLGTAAAAGAWDAATELIYRLALNLALVMLLLGILDYIWQRWQLMKSLRMTKQELREELKRMEGDPLLKQRRRQIAQKLAMQRIAQDVPKAEVIITNPTEFAVALSYVEGEMAAPRVIAKGVDHLALRIRQIAQQHGVPVVQRPPLARALYAAVEVGDEVPPLYYRAVAEVLAYVYQISGRAAARADSNSRSRR